MPADDQLDLPDPAAFIAACRARGIATAIIASQREWTQAPDQPGVDYRRIERSVLLAYRAGTILRCTIDGAAADPAALAAGLAAAGIAVGERSRNLG